MSETSTSARTAQLAKIPETIPRDDYVRLLEYDTDRAATHSISVKVVD